MTFNPDDPKWTAYILGELEGADRAEMDSLLESSEEARAYLEELRVAAGTIEHELKLELKVGLPPEINATVAASLTDAQRAAVLAAASGSGTASSVTNVRWFRQPRAVVTGLAVAAMIVLAVAIPLAWKASQTGKTAGESAISASAGKSNDSIAPSPAAAADQSENAASAPAQDRSAAAPVVVPAAPIQGAVPATALLKKAETQSWCMIGSRRSIRPCTEERHYLVRRAHVAENDCDGGERRVVLLVRAGGIRVRDHDALVVHHHTVA